MRTTRTLAVLALAAISTVACAADWPYWRGPNRDGIAPDTGINKDWNGRPPQVLWQTAMHDGGYAGPSAADGKVFIVDHEGAEDVVRAIDMQTGQDLWQSRYPDLAKADYGFTRSTPVYEGGLLYVVSYLGRVTCLNADDGTTVWSINMPEQFGGVRPRWGYAMSALIDGDRVIVVPGGPDACVAALNRHTGDVIWAGGGSDIPGYATPVKATIQGVEQYVVFAGKALIGVRVADGQLLWRVPWETDWDVNAATPIVSGDHIFITSNYNRGCAVIAVGADGAGILWENTKICAHFNTPVFVKGLMFGSDNVNLVCLNPSTGEILWAQPGFERGGVVAVDEVIIALGGATGDVVMVEASGEAYRELGRIRPLGGQSWTAPILANGKLIIRNKQTLACLDLM
ncbi:MAG: PQQ-binding-like beta-propeller repeat protein [Armatimonadota bacterium]